MMGLSEPQHSNRGSDKNDDEINLTQDQTEGLRELWKYCAEQNVKIPREIRDRIYGESKSKRRSSGVRRHTVIGLREERLSKQSDMFNGQADLIDELRRNKVALNQENPYLQLKIVNGSYKITELVGKTKHRISTVGNKNMFYKLGRKFYKLATSEKSNETPPETRVEKVVLDGINLSFESGKMYLVLGTPGSGKSTLLKMIANSLRRDKDHVVGGDIRLNGYSMDDPNINWTKMVAYSDQQDHLHKHMTIFETSVFAWNCRWGCTHARPNIDMSDPEVVRLVKEHDANHWSVTRTLQLMGLYGIKDTIIGDNSTVRGISGGEKKRVTATEMIVAGVPIYCLDELSTGLDAATTYELVSKLAGGSVLYNKFCIMSLVAPTPETVALFDEVILFDGGRVIYSGDIGEVVEHFESLGYNLPERMDFADWLQSIPANDGSQYLAKKDATHLDSKTFAERFSSSHTGRAIIESVKRPMDKSEDMIGLYENRQNTWYDNLKLLVEREMLLWRRDKYTMRARVIQNLLMGIIAGSLFWQQHENPLSVAGILFQSMFFITLGAVQKIQFQYEVRSIVYKQQDAKFYPTWAYVVGRTLAFVPSSAIDSCMYGTIVYWFVGLAHNDGASIANYFIYLLLIMTSAISTASLLGIFPAVVKNRTTCQALLSLSLVYFVLFSGFTVQLDTVPSYWIWAYWLNPIAWMFRGLMVNEYQSGKYDDLIEGTSTTEGEAILSLLGLVHNGKPFTAVWIWYAISLLVLITAVSIVVTTYFLTFFRHDSSAVQGGKVSESQEDLETYIDNDRVEIPVQKASLTFKNIRYTVKAPTANEPIELLKGVEGIIESGKMTALMGSSGAGKTTLLDVLALRKNSGKVHGEVRLNGHLQEPKSFRRCTGYVEQFDVQSPQLTVRETVEFSAQLRLEETDPNVTPERVGNFVDQTLSMLELIGIQDRQVGEMASGGLTFEQLKRLSIAVELIANPSIIFLDEPTTGLDARAASILMRGLKRIAQNGRAICATIHQPSVAIFNSFDALLLLKQGGETVFFGDLGHESKNLIEYFERYEATPKIQHGENPGTWMLNVIRGSSNPPETRPFDYPGSYAASKLREQALEKIRLLDQEADESNKISFSSKYATSKATQRSRVVKRALKIYWRSPSYNLVRLMVSACVSLLFGSVFASERVPATEGDMNSRVTTIFITFLFLSVTSINTILYVFYVERNMFYRHKAALMYDKKAILLAFTLAEIPFIMLSSMIFVLFFYFMMGFEAVAYKFFLYYLFFTANMMIYTFIGQMLMSLLKNSESAHIFGSLVIAMTTLFSGILIRPQHITSFWLFAYWLLPGHYVLEGLVSSQFHNDDTPITPTLGSEFCAFVADASGRECGISNCYECSGTAEDWIHISFGNEFQFDNLGYDVIYLFCAIVVIKYITYVALMKLNYLVK